MTFNISIPNLEKKLKLTPKKKLPKIVVVVHLSGHPVDIKKVKQLAIKYNCNIVPIYLKRKDNNEFTMEIKQPLRIDQFDSDSNKKSNISKKLNKIIEEMILEDPSQWILTHNRWK